MDNLELERRLNEIKFKLDRLSIIVENMYMLSIFGKRTGLEEKSLNCARAKFMIDKQYKELVVILGKELETTDELEKLKNRCDDIVEYIINAYDGILPSKEFNAEPNFDNLNKEEEVHEEEEEGIKFTGEDMDAILMFMGGAM